MIQPGVLQRAEARVLGLWDSPLPVGGAARERLGGSRGPERPLPRIGPGREAHADGRESARHGRGRGPTPGGAGGPFGGAVAPHSLPVRSPAAGSPYPLLPQNMGGRRVHSRKSSWAKSSAALSADVTSAWCTALNASLSRHAYSQWQSVTLLQSLCLRPRHVSHLVIPWPPVCPANLAA